MAGDPPWLASIKKMFRSSKKESSRNSKKQQKVQSTKDDFHLNYKGAGSKNRNVSGNSGVSGIKNRSVSTSQLAPEAIKRSSSMSSMALFSGKYFSSNKNSTKSRLIPLSAKPSDSQLNSLAVPKKRGAGSRLSIGGGSSRFGSNGSQTVTSPAAASHCAVDEHMLEPVLSGKSVSKVPSSNAAFAPQSPVISFAPTLTTKASSSGALSSTDLPDIRSTGPTSTSNTKDTDHFSSSINSSSSNNGSKANGTRNFSADSISITKDLKTKNSQDTSLDGLSLQLDNTDFSLSSDLLDFGSSAAQFLENTPDSDFNYKGVAEPSKGFQKAIADYAISGPTGVTVSKDKAETFDSSIHQFNKLPSSSSATAPPKIPLPQIQELFLFEKDEIAAVSNGDDADEPSLGRLARRISSTKDLENLKSLDDLGSERQPSKEDLRDGGLVFPDIPNLLDIIEDNSCVKDKGKITDSVISKPVHNMTGGDNLTGLQSHKATVQNGKKKVQDDKIKAKTQESKIDGERIKGDSSSKSNVHSDAGPETLDAGKAQKVEQYLALSSSNIETLYEDKLKETEDLAHPKELKEGPKEVDNNENPKDAKDPHPLVDSLPSSANETANSNKSVNSTKTVEASDNQLVSNNSDDNDEPSTPKAISKFSPSPNTIELPPSPQPEKLFLAEQTTSATTTTATPPSTHVLEKPASPDLSNLTDSFGSVGTVEDTEVEAEDEAEKKEKTGEKEKVEEKEEEKEEQRSVGEDEDKGEKETVLKENVDPEQEVEAEVKKGIKLNKDVESKKDGKGKKENKLKNKTKSKERLRAKKETKSKKAIKSEEVEEEGEEEYAELKKGIEPSLETTESTLDTPAKPAEKEESLTSKLRRELFPDPETKKVEEKKPVVKEPVASAFLKALDANEHRPIPGSKIDIHNPTATIVKALKQEYEKKIKEQSAEAHHLSEKEVRALLSLQHQRDPNFVQPHIEIYTSLATCDRQLEPRTNRMVELLKENGVKFVGADVGTDSKAHKVWRWKGKGRLLPAVVREGEVLCDLIQLEEWAETKEIWDRIIEDEVF